MRKALVLLGALVTLTACGPAAEAERQPTTPAPAAEERPGSPEVYERIAASTDCAALQQEFGTASATHDRVEAGSAEAEVAVAYMEAADERMQAVDCY